MLKPEILTHPHIPKPLHGINPRTINGKFWWNRIRKKVYQKYDYHCAACGVSKHEAKKHQWLEGHEFWQIDSDTGICKVETIEPLCHYCHSFIHSGYLSIRKDKTIKEKIEILEHGFKILSDNNLKSFYWTLDFARKIGAETFNVKSQKRNSKVIKWADWVLIYNKTEYKSPFKNKKEWADYYK